MKKRSEKPNRDYTVIGECAGYIVRIAQPREEDNPNWQQVHIKHKGRRCKQRPKIAFWPRWGIAEKRFAFNREAGWLMEASEKDYNALAKFMEGYFNGKHA